MCNRFTFEICNRFTLEMCSRFTFETFSIAPPDGVSVALGANGKPGAATRHPSGRGDASGVQVLQRDLHGGKPRPLQGQAADRPQQLGHWTRAQEAEVSRVRPVAGGGLGVPQLSKEAYIITGGRARRRPARRLAPGRARDVFLEASR